jgi:hypothetical protein
VVGVGEQVEAQAELVRELLDVLHGVGRDAQHLRPGRVVVGGVVADPARLGGAARRVRLGVEVDNDALAAEVGERDPLALLVGEGELRRRLTNFDHHDVPFAWEVDPEYGRHRH